MSNNKIEITNKDNRKWIDKLMNPKGIAKGYLELKIPALHAYFKSNNKEDDFIGYNSGDSFKHFVDKFYSFEKNETIIEFYPLFFSFTISELHSLKYPFSEKNESYKQLFDDLRNIAIFLDIKCNGNKVRDKNVMMAFQNQVAIMKRVLPDQVIKESALKL